MARKSVKLDWNFILVCRIFNTAELKINTAGVRLCCSFAFDDLVRAARKAALIVLFHVERLLCCFYLLFHVELLSTEFY